MTTTTRPSDTAHALGDEGSHLLRLWQHIYGDGRGYVALFSGVRRAPGAKDLDGVRRAFHHYPEAASFAADWLEDEAARDREVYFAANLVTEKSRKKASAAPVRALWSDGDGTVVPPNLPQPTAIVESSPGRHHYWWRLARALPPAEAETLNRRIAHAIRADLSGWDIGQLLRPPGTPNRKYAGAPLVRLLQLDDDRAIDPDELDRTLPPLPRGGPRNGRSDEQGTSGPEPPVRLTGAAAARWRGEKPVVDKATGAIDRSASLFALAGDLHRARASESTIIAALRERDGALGWEKYTGREDGDLRYAEIADKVARSTPTRARPETGESTSAEPAKTYQLDDVGNAERLLARYGADLRFCADLGGWFTWTGSHWERDRTGAVERMAKAVARGLYALAGDVEDKGERAAVLRHAHTSNSARGIAAMLQLARSEPGVSVLPDAFDRDPWLLACPNGTLELRTGQLREARREELITRCIPVAYDPNAPCPVFETFVRSIMAEKADLVGYLQRVLGYCLTGDVSERVMFVLHGSGSNGKSTLVEIFAELLGPYAATADVGTLMTREGDRVNNDIAALAGARFVAASEAEAGQRLAERLVKRLTGRDSITARFLRCEYFTYRPTFKLWLATNHRPEIRDTGPAMWNRIRLIPFTVTFLDAQEGEQLPAGAYRQDKQLDAKLRQELPGILAWAVRGCLAWQRDGLNAPREVLEATAQYREDMDILAPFIATCCVLHPQASVEAVHLYDEYREHCFASARAPISQKAFGTHLAERGLQNRKVGHAGRVRWFGIGLVAPEGGGPWTRRAEDAEDAEDTSGRTPHEAVYSDLCGNTVRNGPHPPHYSCGSRKAPGSCAVVGCSTPAAAGQWWCAAHQDRAELVSVAAAADWPPLDVADDRVVGGAIQWHQFIRTATDVAIAWAADTLAVATAPPR